MRHENSLSEIVRAIKNHPFLKIHTPQGKAGLLSKEQQYVFNYDPEAVDLSQHVALGLPFRMSSYQSGDLFSVFSMNEPEGYLRLHIEEAMQRIGIPNKLFYLLLSEGMQVGRVGVHHEHIELTPAKTEPLEALLQEHSSVYFEHLVERYALRSGLSGVQPKVLVPIETNHTDNENPSSNARTTLHTPSTIVKTEGIEFPGVCLNEYFCLSVAKAAGLDVAPFWLSDDAQRLILARFDRTQEQNPIGFEDMSVIFGVNAKKKYQGSYEGIMRATITYCAEEDAVFKMFERIATSALLKDGDAHLKNFGLLYQDPSHLIFPSPAFDIVCTAIYPQLGGEMALKMHKRRSFPSNDHLLSFAAKFGVAQSLAQETLDRLQQAIDDTLISASHDERFLKDPHRVLEKIKGALRPNSNSLLI